MLIESSHPFLMTAQNLKLQLSTVKFSYMPSAPSSGENCCARNLKSSLLLFSHVIMCTPRLLLAAIILMIKSIMGKCFSSISISRKKWLFFSGVSYFTSEWLIDIIDVLLFLLHFFCYLPCFIPTGISN